MTTRTGRHGDPARAILRCPRCRAGVRSHDDWCTQCYADLRPEVAPTTQPADDEPLAVEAADSAPAADASPAADSAPAADASPAADPAEVEAIANRMLAELAVAGTAPTTRSTRWAWLTNLTSTNGGKATVMVGGSVLISLVIFAVLALGGTLL